MIEGLTPTEAAERLGVPPTTLVTWLHELPIPQSRDSGGLARLDEEALAVLEAVRGMRAYDLGFQTIRRHLETLDGTDEPAPAALAASAASDAVALVEAEAVASATDLALLAAPGEAEAEGTEASTAATETAATETAVTETAATETAGAVDAWTVDAGAADAAAAHAATPALDSAEIAEAVTRALAPVIAALTELTGAQGRELTAQARLIGQFEADNAFVRRDRDRLAAELVEARARIVMLEARRDAGPAARPWWRFWA